jgi:DNA polymerase-1
MAARLVGISLAVEPGEGYYIPVGHVGTDSPQLPLDQVVERLRPAMTNPSLAKIGHNIKYDAVVLGRHGLAVAPLSFDTMIAQWLIRPDSSRGKLGLKAMAFIRLGIEMTEITDLIGTGRSQITMDRVAIDLCAPYAAADADMTLRLYEPINRELIEHDLERLFNDIEMPLVPVLCAMEQAGVLVDTALLKQQSQELGGTLAALEDQICQIVGYKFNLNSPQQLSDALFGSLGISTQGMRKTRTGFYSTAADVLDSLRDQDTTGVTALLMQYRELEKLRSTYLDALPALVNPMTGRIHTSFNQTGAITGRLSSSDPNLQNIPIRTEQGRRVREAFIAAPGHRLIGADYSQVELRILAHVSGDEGLQQAFREDQDIHTSTAAAVYGIPLDQVSRGQRSFAKSVNFGLLYGMGAYRLARDSNLTLAEAEDFIKAYFERFPKVRHYLDQTRRMAIEHGYVETLLGRRRYFPEFQTQSVNRQDVARAEREAINMPIQGTAADIIKIAMTRLHHALRERGLKGRMILQVHDELLLEAPEDEVNETMILVKEVMEDAYPMDVPLRADLSVGQHWGEMK